MQLTPLARVNINKGKLMNATVKKLIALIACVGIFIAPFFIIRSCVNYNRNKEYISVQQLLESTNTWPNVHLSYAFRSRLMITGTVDSEETANDLRKRLLEIGATRTTLAVQIDKKK